MRVREQMGVAVLVAMLTSVAGAWQISLDVKEQGGVAGPRFVTCGVPLLVGQAKEPADLRLAVKGVTGELTAIPAQFRVLARWWRADNSIRWALVDFQTKIDGKETTTFYLTDARFQTPKPAAELALEQDENTITIATGPARFVINRSRFALLDKAIVDVNGDGRLADDENLLATSAQCGTVIEDTYGQTYRGNAGTKSVEVVEAGPMRVCVRACGRHPAPNGRGYSGGMYGYDVFLNFYAGSTDVFTDVVITNNPPKSTGSPTFEDASLILRLAGGAKGYELVGDTAVEGVLSKGESVCLYQDSNGADTWAQCPGVGHMKSNGWHRLREQITSFRGYRVYRRTTPAARTTTRPAGGGEVIGAGDHARGLLHVRNDRGGLVLHTKHFWHQFPKAVEVFQDGTVRLGLFPREFKAVHFLEDTSAKGHEVVLHFYAAKGKSRYTDASGRVNAALVADVWDNRVYLRPTVEHMGACGALADLGPFTPPTRGLGKQPDTRTVANGPRMLTTDRLYGNAYGWQVFGDRWRSNGGHGRRGARQPISEDNYLWRWYITGSPEWFAAGDARSRHFRDVRIYRVDEQDAFGFKTWQEFRRANRSEKWTNRPQPKSEEYTTYTQGIWSRSDWVFPNPEHTTLDLLYDRYCLMGDVRCLENMRIAAAHGGYFAGRGGTALRGGWPWRANGWGWRTLERYWDLTGDKAAEACLKDVIKTHATHIGKVPLISHHDVKKEQVNWWFTNIYSRAVAITALHTNDPRALQLCKTLAKGKEKDARRVPTLFAVLYHLTGEERYKALVLGNTDGARLLGVGGYFPACDHWLLHQPPKPAEGARPAPPLPSRERAG